MQLQEPAPQGGPVFPAPPWRASANQRHSTSALQSNQFRPQASPFQPGQRLVNGFLPHSNYRIDKTSRYGSRSGQQRPLTTATADQIVQSVEPEDLHLLPNRTSSPSKRGPRNPTPQRLQTPINTSIEPVPVPIPSPAYIKRAESKPQQSHGAKKLLVLLDLNGTLVYRYGTNRRLSVKRPGVDRLLDYLFDNHAVMIFTSATMRSAERVAKDLLTPQQYSQLITIRAREHLGLKPDQFRNKVQVYKDLNKIWSAQEVQQSVSDPAEDWDMTNTVLIDDSEVKAKSHPNNLLQVPEFMHPAANTKKARKAWTEAEILIMNDVETKLEKLKHQISVACQIREWQQAGNASPVVTVDTVDSSALKSIKEDAEDVIKTQKDSIATQEPTGYPTPTSLARDLSSAEEDDEDDDDYDPEQWQGVKLPTASRDSQRAASQPLQSEIVNEKMTTRAVSPVTEANFSWRSEGKDTSAKA